MDSSFAAFDYGNALTNKKLISSLNRCWSFRGTGLLLPQKEY